MACWNQVAAPNEIPRSDRKKKAQKNAISSSPWIEEIKEQLDQREKERQNKQLEDGNATKCDGCSKIIGNKGFLKHVGNKKS